MIFKILVLGAIIIDLPKIKKGHAESEKTMQISLTLVSCIILK
jgi:hypothetical protein